MNIANMDMCSGCGACFSACPKDAIKFQKDEYGREIPKIIEDKCISCNLCVRSCPINQQYFLPSEESVLCYALQAKDRDGIVGCASGGVATVLSRYVVQNLGVVFGCAFNENLDLQYIECETEEQIELLKGSKYAQSNLINCYPHIKKRLQEGKKVLVIGLPCQIAGIKGYLSRDYENLITIDLICHGTPPINYLKEHVRHLSIKNIQNIKFRENGRFIFSIINKNGKEVYSAVAENDEYYYGFLKGISYRENCYRCPYATTKRVSDITLGDFWGLDHHTLTETYEGAISLAIINTQKGRSIFEEVKDYFIYEERDIEEAKSGNDQLQAPMNPNLDDREKFLKYYSRLGYDKAFRKTGLYQKKTMIKKIKLFLLKSSVGQWIRRLKR